MHSCVYPLCHYRRVETRTRSVQDMAGGGLYFMHGISVQHRPDQLRQIYICHQRGESIYARLSFPAAGFISNCLLVMGAMKCKAISKMITEILYLVHQEPVYTPLKKFHHSFLSVSGELQVSKRCDPGGCSEDAECVAGCFPTLWASDHYLGIHRW